MSSLRMHVLIRGAAVALLLACAAGAAAYDAISLTGPFKNWTPEGVPLENADDLWTGVLELQPGVVEMKLTADKSWDVNWGSDQQVVPPARVGLRKTGGNLRVKVDKPGKYRFVFEPETALLSIMPEGEAEGEAAFDAAKFKAEGGDLPRYSLVSIAGSFNSWNPGTFKLKYEAEGVWRGTVDLPAGVVEYKFPTNDNWESSPSYGGFHKDPFIPQRGKAEYVIPNNKLYVAVAGTYLVMFNERTQEFAIEPGPDLIVPPKDAMKPFRFDSMAMPNSINGWQIEERFAMTRVADHDWEWSGPLAKGDLAIKFAGNGSWGYSWGEFRGASAEVPGGGQAALDAPDIHIKVPAEGLYMVTFNDFTNAWTVKKKGEQANGAPANGAPAAAK